MLAPDDLTRPAATITPDGAVEGYASLFGVIDQAGDMVMPGAFTASLARRGLRQVPMLFQHDPAEPIGVWLELTEDTCGLFARGRLIPEVMRARELIALLEAGTADGLSIGFRTVRGRTDPNTKVRRLDAIDLWEISIVTFPLLPGARLALASGQREQSKDAAPDPRDASLHSAARPRSAKDVRLPSRLSPAARMRDSAPVDPSARRFHPERLFRRQPRFRFERAGGAKIWRDLILPGEARRY